MVSADLVVLETASRTDMVGATTSAAVKNIARFLGVSGDSISVDHYSKGSLQDFATPQKRNHCELGAPDAPPVAKLPHREAAVQSGVRFNV